MEQDLTAFIVIMLCVLVVIVVARIVALLSKRDM